MPDEPGVAPGSPPSRPPPGTPPKGARPPPGSDSEQDSGFSDSGSEHLGRCEGTDPEEPPGPGHPHPGPACPGRDLPGPQPPGASRDPRPLLVLLPAPPAAAVPSPEGPLRCHPGPPGVPAELSPCPPRMSPCARVPLLAALALRTGALLRHNRRTQRDIATLRRHTRLLARATSDPRLWPRLWHLLSPAGGTSGASGSHREPPGIGEGE
ncbi:basic proline-rich protein-like [Corvus moneduloides]|uniref:basic proline-rich protein-like n=1 Tax=Corvus moneduloides TaxID=1196302 RepID=UPI001362C291|nr:basic proline-rich protein-like [Corvus moneduloides]